MITFKAGFHGIRTDHEGESKITFVVPLSDHVMAQEVATLFGKLLKIEVSEIETE